jgi:hypothetical protein
VNYSNKGFYLGLVLIQISLFVNNIFMIQVNFKKLVYPSRGVRDT